MLELKVDLDRYDGQSTIPFINANRVKPDPKQPYIETPLGDNEDFAIYFHTTDGCVDDALLESARRLMSRIARIDNGVQASCAAECKRTGLHPRNYEGMLAFVTISHQDARLRYFGTGVNTEWDELAEMRDGSWEYRGTATPGLSANKV